MGFYLKTQSQWDHNTKIFNINMSNPETYADHSPNEKQIQQQCIKLEWVSISKHSPNLPLKPIFFT